MTLADQAGAAFLADVNSAIQALVTNSSGATAPTTTYAYQFWADTTTGILKQRNSANAAWIDLLTLNTGRPVGLVIGTDVQAYNANNAVLNAVQTYSAAQRGTVSALTDAATITPDFAVANNFSLTLGGNRTLANPTNQTAGQSGVIVITQDGTGSRTLAYGSNWKFPSGTAPTLTTTAAAVDVLVYQVESASRITARLIADVK